MLFALLALATVELAVGHILLRGRPDWVVIAHLAIGLFLVVYVIGIIRSFTSLPTTIDNGLLHVRMSVAFDARTELSNIHSISRIASLPDDDTGQLANAAIFVAPNMLIRLNDPVKTCRLFKRPAMARSIALYVDDPIAFASTLERSRAASE